MADNSSFQQCGKTGTSSRAPGLFNANRKVNRSRETENGKPKCEGESDKVIVPSTMMKNDQISGGRNVANKKKLQENGAESSVSSKSGNSLKRKQTMSHVESGNLTKPTYNHHQDPITYASVVKHDKENLQPHQLQITSMGVNVSGNTSTKRLKIDLMSGDAKPIVSKPPLPPKPDVNNATVVVTASKSSNATHLTSSTPTSSKSKKHVVDEANATHTVQKLLVQNEQMRLEIGELRSNLATERNAVRVLRAQNDSDLRRSKSECKKLQEALFHQKRNAAASLSAATTNSTSSPAKQRCQVQSHLNSNDGGQPISSSIVHQLNLDVLKLNQELSALKETNKFLEEKIQISSEAERRKASDIRVQRDLYELRLTQLTKSAKSEIQRLLDELKTKDRTIGLLKKEISALHSDGGGGCGGPSTKKERKAVKNSAQQSQEMRKLREPELCSGNISTSTSHSSIQSVCNVDYEQNDADQDLINAHQIASEPRKYSLSPPLSASLPDRLTTKDCTNSFKSINLALETTCSDEKARSQLHEKSRTMEAHDDEYFTSARIGYHQKKDNSIINDDDSAESPFKRPITTNRQFSTISDADSAISSAPPSLSPQPTGCPNSPEVWRAHSQQQHQQQESQDHHLLQQRALHSEAQLTEIRLELDQIQSQYAVLRDDYNKAKSQIDELERDLVEAKHAAKEKAKLAKRIEILEQREESLLRESHELREQNELLEFRIIELEESHDKWSVRSNSSPPVGGGSTGSSSNNSGNTNESTSKDVWNDPDKEQDELIMHSERSDSGVTSPNSNHQLDDTRTSGIPSPCCDLSLLDQIPTDDVRKRIVTMTKRSCYDEEDKLCLLQILTLLNNLEALSQDQEIVNEDMSLELPKYNYPFPESHLAKSPITSTPFKSTNGKIVATVQPFSNSSTTANINQTEPQKSFSIASIAETFGGMKKSSSSSTTGSKWGSMNLQESGVFLDEAIVSSTATQTEVDDFPGLERTNAELRAEIEKLNKFRQKIEECTERRSKKNPVSVSLSLPAESCEQRRLQFYIDRLEQCENKLKVYESSGDQQMRHLAERLQREIQLESWVRQLSEKVDKLEDENERLEEERCELEEIENDTRLRLQRMEIEYEMMSQRNSELELGKSSYQSKYQDARDSIVSLEELVHKCEERIFILEETENELNDRIDLILAFIPVLLMFNSWKLQQDMVTQPIVAGFTRAYDPVEDHIDYYESSNDDLQARLSELMTREKELTQNISELNRAYNETLENADNLWAQMEKEYKDKISKCEMLELNLKSKISQLEERLSKDSEYAHERIAHLEEAENNLKGRVSKLNKENKELISKHTALLEEYTTLKEEYRKLQNYLQGPAVENLEREKRKIVSLEEELSLSSQALKEAEDTHKAEVGAIRCKLASATKELNHIEVTNSELREEVETLEARIRELLTLRSGDEERIKNLTEELQAKQAQISQLHQQQQQNCTGSRSHFGRSLAQELERPVKGSYCKLGYEVHPLNRRFPGDSDSSGSEDRVKFPVARSIIEPQQQPQKEVKSLAETIIMNAENRIIRAPKKSFVEEARSRFARWV